MKLTVLVTSFFLIAATASAGPFQVTLDTSSLSGLQTLGFGLTNFNSASNVMSLTGFDFHGGSAAAGSQDCTLGGTYSGAGCAGDLSAGITLQDLDPAAEFFTQQFTAGSSMSFVLNASNAFTGAGIPDQLAMYVCDGAFATCYSDDASGAMLLLDLVGGVLSASSFVTFPSTLQGLHAPIVTEITQVPDPPTPVPEPGSVLLFGVGVAALAIRRRCVRAIGG